MRYKKFGNTYHIVIENAQDLFALKKIDPALWVATSAPVGCFSVDKVFLTHLDKKHIQRILYDDLLTEIAWLQSMYVHTSGVNISSDLLDIDSLDQDHQQVKQIATIYHSIVNNHDRQYVSLAAAREKLQEIEQTSVSENGVVIASVAVSSKLQEFIELGVKVTGGQAHPSGQNGLDETTLATYKQTLTAYIQWRQQYNEALQQNQSSDFLTFGAETEQLYKMYLQFKDKIDHYFLLSRAQRFIESTSDSALTTEKANQVSWQDSNAIQAYLKEAPLASPDKECVLHYQGHSAINPFYSDALLSFLNEMEHHCQLKLSGKLSQSQWEKIKEQFDGFDHWYHSNPSSVLDGYDLEVLKEYESSDYEKSLQNLIAQSIKTKEKLECAQLLEKVILYQIYMIPFVQNFVSFIDLYNAEKNALFEKGRLIMNGWHFNFVIDVEDITTHKVMASSSFTFVLYLNILTNGQVINRVCVPVTQGTSTGLIKGKRGVFIDTQGNKYDAVVADFITNPVSLKEALLEPFIKIKQLFTKRIESDADQSELKVTQAANDLMSQTNRSQSTPLKPQESNKPFGGAGTLLLSGSIAFAAVGSTITYIVNTIAESSLYNIIIIIACLLGVLVLPILISGVYKLKKRNLTPIFEASGWAINSNMRLTKSIYKLFTQKPKWPKSPKKNKVK